MDDFGEGGLLLALAMVIGAMIAIEYSNDSNGNSKDGVYK